MIKIFDRYKIYFLLSFAIVIGILVIALLHSQNTAAAPVASEELQRLAQVTADQQTLLSEQAEQLLTLLSQVPAVVHGDSAPCSAFLQPLIANQKQILNFGVVDASGTLICSALPASTTYAGDRPYFTRAMTSNAFSVGNYQIGRVTGKPSINFALPIDDASGTPQRVVFAAFSLAWLHGYSRIALPPNAQLIITDSEGQVLERYPYNAAGYQAPEIDLSLEKIIDVDTGLGEIDAQDASGQNYYLVVAPVKLAGQEGFLHVIVSVPRQLVSFARQTNDLATIIRFVFPH